MNKQKIFLLILAALVIFVSCAPGSGANSPEEPAGFFMGIWHGWIAPITLIVGIFNSDIRIYEIFNTGWWYDFGFYMAIIGGFGGIALSRKKKKHNEYR